MHMKLNPKGLLQTKANGIPTRRTPGGAPPPRVGIRQDGDHTAPDVIIPPAAGPAQARLRPEKTGPPLALVRAAVHIAY